jgi:hypothetical protein
MSFTQGAALPDIKTTETRTDTAPSYYTDYLTDISKVGTDALKTPTTSLVAGYDPLQTSGYLSYPAAATAGTKQMTAAQTTAGEAAKGITPQNIQALMNPYTQNVVDEMGRLSQQNVQRTVLPSLKAGFVGTGGLGGQRYANVLGQTMADIQSGLTGQQYGALSQGYTQAMKGALDEAQLQNMVAGTQGKLSDQEQQQALTGAGALTKAGAEKQAYEQAKIDAPLKNAMNVSGLMKGYTMPLSQTSTFVGPKAGNYQMSDLQQVLGALSAVGSVAGGKGLDSITKMGSSLGNYLNGLASGNMTTMGTYRIDPTELAGPNAEGKVIYYDRDTSQYYDTSGNIVPISNSEGEG